MSTPPSGPPADDRQPSVLVLGQRDGHALEVHAALDQDSRIEVIGSVRAFDHATAAVQEANPAAVVVVAEHDSAVLWRTLMAIARPPAPVPVVLVAPAALQHTAFLTGAEDWLDIHDGLAANTRHLVRAIHNAVIRRRVASGLPTHGHLHGLVSGVAHEVNNPLTVIHANLEEACENLTDLIESIEDPATKDELEGIHEILVEDQEAAHRIGALSRGLQNLARLANTVPAALHTGPAIRRVMNRFQRAYPTAPPPEVNGRTDWRVHASVFGFEEAMFHILENALNANRAAGTTAAVEVEITTRTGQVELYIRDRGPGVRADLVDRVLSPFVTSSLPGGGLGLGLTLTALALRRSGGDVDLRPRTGGGTEVCLSFLPARAEVPLLFEADDPEDIAAR
ncbi:MAG: hypothetical protein CL927_18835 [Deltaproteobacteria bacterium]|nr:hypothetical protein [Deltaproteobacteria bacterium]HCH64016.1 hypothetical protein [Deltaproteobacteria bacterium]